MKFFRLGKKNLALCVSLLNVGQHGWKKVHAETEMLEGFPCEKDEALVKVCLLLFFVLRRY